MHIVSFALQTSGYTQSNITDLQTAADLQTAIKGY